MSERMTMALCINSSHSDGLLMGGESYALGDSELHFGVRYVRIYELPPIAWVQENFLWSEEHVWRLIPLYGEAKCLGMWSIHRFEPLIRKPDITREISRIEERAKFTGSKIAGPTQLPSESATSPKDTK